MTVRWSRPNMGSTLDVDQIAELLRFYEDALSSVRSALTDLELSPSYIMLTDASVNGETTRRYGQVAKESMNLWPLSEAAAIQLEGTRHVLERTKGKGKNRLELIGYLHDPWYEITTLEGEQSRRYSIQQTFAEIAQLYNAVMVGVEEVDALWSSIMPRIKAAQRTMGELERQTKELGVAEPLVGRTKTLALDLAGRLTSDPLSVTIADGPALDIKVSEAARQVASLQTGRDNLQNDMVQAAELVAVVRVLRERAEAAWKETTEKIPGAKDLVRVPSEQIIDGPEGLAKRLETATNLELGGDWSQRRTVLDLWLSTARRLRDQLEKAESANQAPLNYRDELRGRLRAYQAKAAGIGEAEDLELSERFEQVRLVLYTSPTDLSKAEELLTHLAARLKK